MFRVRNIAHLFLITFLAFFLIQPALFADDMNEAVYNAIEKIADSGKISNSETIAISTFKNFHSYKSDVTTKKIIAQVFVALQDFFPKAKILDPSQAVFGVKLTGAVFIQGTYEPRGSEVVVHIQALDDLTKGRVIAHAEAKYDSKVVRRKTLVAALDIEAPTLEKMQIKAFSDIFRGELAKSNDFQLSSSAEIDKMDPDQVQEVSGCTRDECATIIGEQLGVERVVSCSFREVTKGLYYLSAKMIDINNGAILAQANEKHTGDLMTLDQALSRLAISLTGRKPSISSIVAKNPEAQKDLSRFGSTEASGSSQPLLPEPVLEEDDGWPWWAYAAIGVGLAAGVAAAAGGGDSGGSDGGSGNDGSVSASW